jgi:cytochrome c-type biogenesis protein
MMFKLSNPDDRRPLGVFLPLPKGPLLLAAYLAGLGIPFLLAAFAMKPFMALLKRMRSRFPLVEKTMGSLLVLTGIAFLTGWITTMLYWLLETFPALATLG